MIAHQAPVNVQMLNTKFVPLSFEVSGAPAEGFIYTGYTNEPGQIQICGTKEALDAVSVIEVPASELDISGQSGRREVTVESMLVLGCARGCDWQAATRARGHARRGPTWVTQTKAAPRDRARARART